MPIAGAGKLIEAMRNLKHSSQDAKKAEQRLRNMWEEATSDNVQLWLALRELGFKRTKKSEFEDAKNKFVSEKTNRIISECWLVHKRNGQTCKQRSGSPNLPKGLDPSKVWIVDKCIPLEKLGAGVMMWETAVGNRLSVRPSQEGTPAVEDGPAPGSPKGDGADSELCPPEKKRPRLQRHDSDPGGACTMHKIAQRTADCIEKKQFRSSDLSRSDTVEFWTRSFVKHVETAGAGPFPEHFSDCVKGAVKATLNSRCYSELKHLTAWLQKLTEKAPALVPKMGQAMVQLASFDPTSTKAPDSSMLDIYGSYNFADSELHKDLTQQKAGFALRALKKNTATPFGERAAKARGLLDASASSLTNEQKPELSVVATVFGDATQHAKVMYMLESADRFAILREWADKREFLVLEVFFGDASTCKKLGRDATGKACGLLAEDQTAANLLKQSTAKTLFEAFRALQSRTAKATQKGDVPEASEAKLQAFRKGDPGGAWSEAEVLLAQRWVESSTALSKALGKHSVERGPFLGVVLGHSQARKAPTNDPKSSGAASCEAVASAEAAAPPTAEAAASAAASAQASLAHPAGQGAAAPPAGAAAAADGEQWAVGDKCVLSAVKNKAALNEQKAFVRKVLSKKLRVQLETGPWKGQEVDLEKQRARNSSDVTPATGGPPGGAASHGGGAQAEADAEAQTANKAKFVALFGKTDDIQ
ncbi:unnamed protein product [Prorocentrum cordatum]|uniref:Uncharacterized protein n=1 Tax=Prorocentrum cordatum TaxID=2364126 RepID=A0ABN9S6P4_9DINO|nr:unnamed protein product [Polarella glacialis]